MGPVPDDGKLHGVAGVEQPTPGGAGDPDRVIHPRLQCLRSQRQVRPGDKSSQLGRHTRQLLRHSDAVLEKNIMAGHVSAMHRWVLLI